MSEDKFKYAKLLWDSCYAFPYFLHCIYLFQRYDSLAEVLDRIVITDRNANRYLDSEKKRRLVRVSNALTKVFMPRTEGRCLLRSLVLYRLLKHHGENPVFLAGVRRIDGKLESHAWVELDGRCLDGTGDNFVRHTYTVNVSSENFVGK